MPPAPTSRKPPRSRATEAFGERIRLERQRLGLSQEALAEATTLHWSYVGKVERGQVNPTLHNILRLADALGVDAGQLVSDLPSPPTS